MLVCPHCQFENSYLNKFCQQCGISLSHHACTDCGTQVAFSEPYCPNCHCLTGQTLWVILAETISATDSLEPEVNEIDSKSFNLPFYGDFLDLGQRYRLFESTDDPNRGFQAINSPAHQRFFQGRVFDCQPLQKSVLSVLLDQQSILLGDSPLQEDAIDSLCHQLGIPDLARPYLSLKDFVPTLPTVYEAWQTESWAVLLLSDRSPWQSLSDLLRDHSLPMLQVTYWLNEMVTLWKSLEPFACQQSLLVPGNLRVDEDQIFGLVQLYPNLDGVSPSLPQLAQFWKHLLTPADPAGELLPLFHLCDRILSEEITTIADLRILLQDLADAEQEAPELDDRSSTPESEAILPASHRLPLEEEIELFPIELPDPLTTISESDDLSTAVLPMEMLSLAELGTTDRGRQRPHNEDFFGIYSQIKLHQTNLTTKMEANGLYVVCDGMGGHAAGEVASQLAVESLQTYFQHHGQNSLPSREIIQNGIWQANHQLYQINQDNASMGSGRMGTTLVMMLLQNTQIAIAHVGDSRIYRINRKWGLEQLTVDHEVGQKAMQSGLDPKLAYSRPDAYQLTQALGPHDNEYVQPDIRFLEIQEDTLFLLCSDGLSDNELLEDNWESLLLPLVSSHADLDKGLKKLIDFANQHNGHDNITAILVRLKVKPSLEP